MGWDYSCKLIKIVKYGLITLINLIDAKRLKNQGEKQQGIAYYSESF